ncbi:uncharacterized protein BXZ73DRAFT_98107 [Epithele typhae]|uniref:uncharacterized protein n=1 Tax=Epithele typhae TaxID=378194 RepID=UPI00200896EA|nr:uncharacterized protein BXZ73DRAFT_98107 [Epithele typhae]KAH9941714.1 hypothetical protein BXZ73DRAFT_98107 [Epithele typhae]
MPPTRNFAIRAGFHAPGIGPYKGQLHEDTFTGALPRPDRPHPALPSHAAVPRELCDHKQVQMQEPCVQPGPQIRALVPVGHWALRGPAQGLARAPIPPYPQSPYTASSAASPDVPGPPPSRTPSLAHSGSSTSSSSTPSMPGTPVHPAHPTAFTRSWLQQQHEGQAAEPPVSGEAHKSVSGSGLVARYDQQLYHAPFGYELESASPNVRYEQGHPSQSFVQMAYPQFGAPSHPHWDPRSAHTARTRPVPQDIHTTLPPGMPRPQQVPPQPAHYWIQPSPSPRARGSHSAAPAYHPYTRQVPQRYPQHGHANRPSLHPTPQHFYALAPPPPYAPIHPSGQSWHPPSTLLAQGYGQTFLPIPPPRGFPRSAHPYLAAPIPRAPVYFDEDCYEIPPPPPPLSPPPFVRSRAPSPAAVPLEHVARVPRLPTPSPVHDALPPPPTPIAVEVEVEVKAELPDDDGGALAPAAEAGQVVMDWSEIEVDWDAASYALSEETLRMLDGFVDGSKPVVDTSTSLLDELNGPLLL